jgi:drug/metabolite transporter (DMT)-like permease
MGSWQVAGFRSGIAAVALWLLLPGARRGWTWRTGLIGIAYAATLVLFVLANKLTTSANAIFLQSTAPLYLLLLGPLVLHERIRRIDLVVITVLAGGVWLLLSGSQTITATAPDPVKGNVLGALSGLTWALTLTGLRWLGKKGSSDDSGAATVIVGNLIAFLVCLPFAVPVELPSLLSASVLLYLGVFQVGLAYVALTRSIRHVPGLEASTLLLVEPVFNPIWTWLIHGERPGASALLGGLVIILVALGTTWWQSRQRQCTIEN